MLAAIQCPSIPLKGEPEFTGSHETASAPALQDNEVFKKPALPPKKKRQIKNSEISIKMVQRGSRMIAAEFVDETTAWKRPTGYHSASTKDDLSDVVHANFFSFKGETVKVAMK